MMPQSSSMIRFLSSISIDPDNSIVLNKFDDTLEFVSRFYTPHYKITILAGNVLADIKDGVVPTAVIQEDQDSLITHILNSNLEISRPHIYTLCRAVLLEAFSIVYTLNDKEEYIKYIDEDEITEVRETIKYLQDTLGKYDQYGQIVKGLQDMDIAMGFIQVQLPEVREGMINGTL